MDKNNYNTKDITPDLILRYVEDKVDFDEWLAVFTAERENKNIRDIVKEVRKIHELNASNTSVESVPTSSKSIYAPAENPRSIGVCEFFNIWERAEPEKENAWLIQHAELPIERWAAKNDSNDCVIRCEQFVLKQFGIMRSLVDLRTEAEFEKWRKDEGTPLYHIGRLIEDSITPDGVRFSLARFTGGTLDKICHELDTNCCVILVISQGGEVADHAIVVTVVTPRIVEFFDPSNPDGISTLTHAQLLEKWKFSHYFMVSITLRGRRPYTPHPEDLSDISLDEGINALVPALMENAHEVWAKGRQAKGWKYGEEKNDDLKLTPFMLPYLEMKDKDKETDRLTVVNTLKLLIKMGYKIVKRYDTNFVFNSNQRNADGEYIANPIDLESVNLPDNIIVLREYIAENAHENWSLQRFKEGWVYGDKTDKDKKVNKDLVPYCELLESEKQYDRNMAYDTLRLLYKMGYVIEKNKD